VEALDPVGHRLTALPGDADQRFRDGVAGTGVGGALLDGGHAPVE
jgi:hypothetical protein